MESDDGGDIYRQDSDSNDDYGDSDDSWESFTAENGSGSRHRESDSSDGGSEGEVVVDIDDQGDTGRRRGRVRRGRGPIETVNWSYLQEPETGNAMEWLLQFDEGSSGIKNLDDRPTTDGMQLAHEQVQQRQTARPGLTPAAAGPRPQRIGAPHYPDKYENVKYKPKCVVCKEIGLRCQSSYYCEPCQAALCITPCFKIYHTLENITRA